MPKITCLEHFGNNGLVSANSEGVITVLNTSTELATNVSNPTLLLCANAKLGYLFSSDLKSTAFELPSLNLVPKLGLRGVEWGCCLNQEIAVVSNNAIRFLKVVMHPSPNLIVQTKLDLPNVMALCHSKDMLGIGTRDQYLLVKRSDFNFKVPLFPVINNLKPLITVFKNEFLVVQGTNYDEMATGLVVDLNGEFSKRGVVIQWPKYPTVLLAWGDTVLALINTDVHLVHVTNENVVHHLPPKMGVQRMFKLKHQLHVKDPELVLRLGPSNGCLVPTRIAFVTLNNDIEYFLPANKLVSLETEIMNSTNLNYPRAVFEGLSDDEILYLQYLITLRYLSLQMVENAVKVCPSFDYACDLFNKRDAFVFPGLESLYSKVQSMDCKQFYKLMLKHELNRKLSNDRRKSVELMLIEVLNDEEVCAILLDPKFHSKHELLKQLETRKKYEILEQFYSITEQPVKLVDLWLEILNTESSNSIEKSQAVKAMISFVHTNEDLCVFERIKRRDELQNAIVLLAASASASVSADSTSGTSGTAGTAGTGGSGLSLLTNKAVEKVIDYTTTCDLLKQQPHPDLWREYLKYLVFHKNMFKSKLVDLVVSDLLGLGLQYKNDIIKSYEVYKQLEWPKPKYTNWVDNYVEYPSICLNLQHDFWDLMGNADMDFSGLVHTFDSNLEFMLAERSAIYASMGIHNALVDLLFLQTDYMSLIYYPLRCHNTADSSSGSSGSNTQVQISHVIFNGLLNTSNYTSVLPEFLAANEEFVDLKFVLESVPKDMNISVISEFIAKKVFIMETEKLESQLVYAVSRASLK